MNCVFNVLQTKSMNSEHIWKLYNLKNLKLKHKHNLDVINKGVFSECQNNWNIIFRVF